MIRAAWPAYCSCSPRSAGGDFSSRKVLNFFGAGSHGTIFVPWALVCFEEPTAQKACRGYPITAAGFTSITLRRTLLRNTYTFKQTG